MAGGAGAEHSLSRREAAWLFAMLARRPVGAGAAYANSYMAHHRHKVRRFFTFFTLSLTATMGIALSANFFTLYCSTNYWPLSPGRWSFTTKLPTRAGRAGFTSYTAWREPSVVLAAMVATWWVAGTLDFTPGGLLRLRVPGRDSPHRHPADPGL